MHHGFGDDFALNRKDISLMQGIKLMSSVIYTSPSDIYVTLI